MVTASTQSVSPSGLTGTTVGVSTWTGHPAVAVYICLGRVSRDSTLTACCALNSLKLVSAVRRCGASRPPGR